MCFSYHPSPTHIFGYWSIPKLITKLNRFKTSEIPETDSKLPIKKDPILIVLQTLQTMFQTYLVSLFIHFYGLFLVYRLSHKFFLKCAWIDSVLEQLSYLIECKNEIGLFKLMTPYLIMTHLDLYLWNLHDSSLRLQYSCRRLNDFILWFFWWYHAWIIMTTCIFILVLYDANIESTCIIHSILEGSPGMSCIAQVANMKTGNKWSCQYEVVI